MKISGLNLKSKSFIMLITVKMPTMVGILTFMSKINFMLSWVEIEKSSYITSGPGRKLWRQGLLWRGSFKLHHCKSNQSKPSPRGHRTKTTQTGHVIRLDEYPVWSVSPFAATSSSAVSLRCRLFLWIESTIVSLQVIRSFTWMTSL